MITNMRQNQYASRQPKKGKHNSFVKGMSYVANNSADERYDALKNDNNAQLSKA